MYSYISLFGLLNKQCQFHTQKPNLKVKSEEKVMGKGEAGVSSTYMDLRRERWSSKKVFTKNYGDQSNSNTHTYVKNII